MLWNKHNSCSEGYPNVTRPEGQLKYDVFYEWFFFSEHSGSKISRVPDCLKNKMAATAIN